MDVDGLIERLRKDAPPLGLEYWDPTYDVRQEAATALATLRDEREAAWASVQPEIEKRKAAEAERDRLRDELAKAHRVLESQGRVTSVYPQKDEVAAITAERDRLRDAIRTALNEEAATAYSILRAALEDKP